MEKFSESEQDNSEDSNKFTDNFDYFNGNLKPQHQAFVHAYLESFHASQSAIRAGYSPHTARQIAWELMQRSDIKEELERLTRLKAEYVQVNQFQLLDQLMRIATADLKDFISWDDNGIAFVDPEKVDGQLIAELKIDTSNYTAADGGKTEKSKKRLKLHDKLKALELLGKHVGLWNDKINLLGDVKVQIIDDIKELDDTP